MSSAEFLIALIGVAAMGGILLVAYGMRTRPVSQAVPERSKLVSRVQRTVASWPKYRKVLAVLGFIAGILTALISGWLVALILVPAAAIGVPYLLSSQEATQRIRKLEAIEEWTRSLSGLLNTGARIEQSIVSSLGSTNPLLRTDVQRLCARLRAGWPTQTALKAFGDDLNDPTGDLVVAYLLSAANSGSRIAPILAALAADVSEDVRNRRTIEASREQPRSTVRIVTVTTLVVGGGLFLVGDYMAPYGTPFGQVLLIAISTAYVAVLVWMRRTSAGKPSLRFLHSTAKPGDVR